MSSQRFAPEFKDEAVRQIVERLQPITIRTRQPGAQAAVTLRSPHLLAQHPRGTADLARDRLHRSILLRNGASRKAGAIHSVSRPAVCPDVYAAPDAAGVDHWASTGRWVSHRR
jgi:hypothetical protein